MIWACRVIAVWLVLATPACVLASDASSAPPSIAVDEAALDRFADAIRKRCVMMSDGVERNACLRDLNARIYPVLGSTVEKDYSWLAEQWNSGVASDVANRDLDTALAALPFDPIVWTEADARKAFESIDTSLGRGLKDPYSVRAYALSQPFACRNVASLDAMCVCARYNGRNSHGAYVGRRLEMYVFAASATLAYSTGSEESDVRCEGVAITTRDPSLIEAAADRTSP